MFLDALLLLLLILIASSSAHADTIIDSFSSGEGKVTKAYMEQNSVTSLRLNSSSLPDVMGGERTFAMGNYRPAIHSDASGYADAAIANGSLTLAANYPAEQAIVYYGTQETPLGLDLTSRGGPQWIALDFDYFLTDIDNARVYVAIGSTDINGQYRPVHRLYESYSEMVAIPNSSFPFSVYFPVNDLALNAQGVRLNLANVESLSVLFGPLGQTYSVSLTKVSLVPDPRLPSAIAAPIAALVWASIKRKW